MAPMKGAGLRGGSGGRADQRAVGNRGEFLRHRCDDFAGGPIVRVVVAGEPVARVLVLALSPRLPRFFRVTVVGSDKIKSAPRLARIVDRDLDFLAGGERARQRNLQLAVRSFESGGLSTRADRLDVELGGVEFEALERTGDRGKPMRRGARDFLRVEVERDLELNMVDVGVAVARPFRLDVLRLKRAASAGEGDSEGLAIAEVQRKLIEKARLVHGVMLRTGAAARNREVTVHFVSTMTASLGASVSGDFADCSGRAPVVSRILPDGKLISRGSAVKFSATTRGCDAVSRWNTRQSSGAPSKAR